MSKFLLSCCSTADLTKEYLERRNIEYVRYPFTMDDVEYFDDLGQTIPYVEFYDRIAKGSMPTTSQVNVEGFIAFFEPFLKQGNDILHVAFSSGLSGSYNNARLAAEDLSAKYPDRKIRVLDSLAASRGHGLLVDALADLRDMDKSVDEVYKWGEENKLNVHHWFISSDLSHYKRGGRISGASAFVGNMFNICPLMNVSNEGKLVPRKKIRTTSKAIEEMVGKMEEYAVDGINYSGKCFIGHSGGSYEDARKTADLVEKKFKKLNGKVQVSDIGAIIGSHTGPGTVALFFFGDKRID